MWKFEGNFEFVYLNERMIMYFNACGKLETLLKEKLLDNMIRIFFLQKMLKKRRKV